MSDCVECGKRLGFFEGHCHPTMGKKSLVCWSCFLKVEESVAIWRDFILSNSFNPKSSKATSPVEWSSLFQRIFGNKKSFTKSEAVESVHITPERTSGEMTLDHLNYNNNTTLVQFGKGTV